MKAGTQVRFSELFLRRAGRYGRKALAALSGHVVDTRRIGSRVLVRVHWSDGDVSEHSIMQLRRTEQ